MVVSWKQGLSKEENHPLLSYDPLIWQGFKNQKNPDLQKVGIWKWQSAWALVDSMADKLGSNSRSVPREAAGSETRLIIRL